MKWSVIKDIILKLILSFIFALAVTWDSYNNFNYTNFFIAFGLTFLILSLIWRRLTEYKLADKKPPKLQKSEFLVFGFFTFGVLFFAFLAHYPTAIVNNDTITQLNQTYYGDYTNWHPLLHTLFVFELPKIFSDNVPFVSIFQAMLIFAIIMYFCYFCRKNFLNFWQTILALLLIILNPSFMTWCMSPGKDTLFAWAIFLSTLCLIQITISDGKWLKNWGNKVLLIIASLGVLCFRHNGIVPFVLMYVILAIAYAKARIFSIVSLVTIMATFLVLTGPIYSLLEIPGTGGIPETVGLMMGQLMIYQHNMPEEFSEKEWQTLHNIAREDLWRDQYDARDFNYIKADDSVWWTYQDNIKANLGDLINIYVTKSVQHPKMFLRSYFNMTSPIWEIGRPYKMSGQAIDPKYYTVWDDDMQNTAAKLREREFAYDEFIENSPFRLIFIDVGEGLMMIIFALALTIKKVGRKLKAYLPFVAVLANTAVIMLMITGMETRFVYSQALVGLPLLLYSFYITRHKISP